MIFLGNISPRSAELMFLRMFAPDTDTGLRGEPLLGDTGSDAVDMDPEVLKKLAGEFGRRVCDDAFTPAQLQGYLLGYRRDPRGAVDGVEKWAEDEKLAAEEMKARARKEREKRAERRRKRRAPQVNIINNSGVDLGVQKTEGSVKPDADDGSGDDKKRDAKLVNGDGGK
jgi:chaperone BCS1